jgi:ribonuclease Z
MGDYRHYYFPNTEELAPDEMRVIALGTGRPYPRPSQANTGWLIELGNGDKFMFDFGFGTQMRFAALEIPYQDITACFASHLHSDHVGDFAQIWVASWVGGRTTPLVVYGPSGLMPEHGMRHFVQKQRESFAWDTATRVPFLPAVGEEIDVHEFDYSKVQTIYDRNGVQISSFPAIHILDGPVGFRLEWNGLTLVYSGDTIPNGFLVENAKNADLLIHETYNTLEQLVARTGHDRKGGAKVAQHIHTDPADVGRILAMCDPKHVAVFHFYNDFDTAADIERLIRQSYGGPLALAQDLMVFNVTREKTIARMTATGTHVYPNTKYRDAYRSAPRKEKPAMSAWLLEKQLLQKSPDQT